MKVWRYDERKFQVGDQIEPESGKSPQLTPEQWGAEKIIRSAQPGGKEIRESSVYCFEERRLANLGANRTGRCLYELEIKQEDIQHRGDLFFYDRVAKKIKSGEDPADDACQYWNGTECPQRPAIELLVRRAIVVAVHSVDPIVNRPTTSADDYGL
tara:strand:+ start:529 stop:996 length:468 start_codon:yes stop_codon:yes gene_type:complete